jgi:O-antigen/teichoic acid export membrane protein
VSAVTDRRPAATASSGEAIRRLFGRGSIYTLVLAIQMSAGFIVVPLVTRLLSARGYGEVAAGLVVFSTLSIIAAAGMPEAASRAFFQSEEGPRHARQLVMATVLLALGAAVIADLTGPLWSPLFNLQFSGVLRLAVWSAAGAAVLLAVQSLLRASDRPWSFLLVALLASVGGQGLGVILLMSGNGSPASYMAGLTIGTGGAALLGVILTGAARTSLPNRAQARRALALGLPLVPHSLATFLLVSADRVAISRILGLGAVGRYQVAYAIGGFGVSMITALNQAWLPLLLGAEREQRWEILRSTSRAVHRIAALIAAAIALATPAGLLVAAPASYGRGELVAVSAVVAFSIVPYATSCTYFHAIFLEGRTKMMAVAAPLAVAVNLAVNIALLPVTGLVGAAIATVVSYAFLAAFSAWVSGRVVRLPGVLRDSLISWAVAAPLVAAGAWLPLGVEGTAVRLVLGAGLAVAAVRVALGLKRTRLAEAAAEPPHEDEGRRGRFRRERREAVPVGGMR